MKENWDLLPGNYELGNSKSSVAVVTLSENFKNTWSAKVAIWGRMQTENLGIVRVMKNLMANPHIRHIIVCGKDVRGHYSGDALVCLFNNGAQIESNNRIFIKGTKAANPQLPIKPETLEEFTDRLHKQFGLTDLREESNIITITEKIEELLQRNLPPLEEPYSVEIKESKRENPDYDRQRVALHSRVKISFDGEILSTEVG